MTKELKEQWDECVKIIRDNISAEQYDTWFACIEPRSYNDQQLLLAVPSQFVYERLESTYIDLIYKVITRVFGHGVQLSYTIRQIQNREEALKQSDSTIPHNLGQQDNRYLQG